MIDDALIGLEMVTETLFLESMMSISDIRDFCLLFRSQWKIHQI